VITYDVHKKINKFLEKRLADNHIELLAEDLEKIVRYIHMIVRWNRVYNLTADSDPEQLIDKHIIESLLVADLVKDRNADVGAGAGFPSILLAIKRPDAMFTLIESRGKKARFLKDVCLALQLKNVNVIYKRVEDYTPHTLYDCVLSRAFANIALMLKLTEHLCLPEGEFVALKNFFPEEELSALPDKFKVLEVKPIVVVGDDKKRCAVRIGFAQRKNINEEA
jgi:16S rRNA (guanine527-N7)-methyltransferase